MCDNKYPPETAFLYLEEIRTTFLNTFTTKEIENAIAYSLKDQFTNSLKDKLVNNKIITLELL